MKKIWLHRISHCYEISNPLLDKGYLSIGFADFLDFENCFENLTASNYDGDKRTLIKSIAAECWGTGDHRTIYNLERFLTGFKPHDLVLVPSYGAFSIYEIGGKAIKISDLPPEIVSGLNPIGMADKVYLNAKGRLCRHLSNDEYDLGFLWPVTPYCINDGKVLIKRDFAESDLTARLKMRQTNGDITDLKKSVENALECFKNNSPPNLHAKAMNALAKTFLDLIKVGLNPDKFERLIRWFLLKTGADNAVIIPKNENGKRDEADADIEAIFEALKIRIYIQAKFHSGTTDDWAVQQIKKYAIWKNEADDEYTTILWVITSADNFTEAAIRLAKSCDESTELKMSVRLIDGLSFAALLLDAGVNDINQAFLP